MSACDQEEVLFVYGGRDPQSNFPGMVFAEVSDDFILDDASTADTGVRIWVGKTAFIDCEVWFLVHGRGVEIYPLDGRDEPFEVAIDRGISPYDDEVLADIVQMAFRIRSEQARRKLLEPSD